MEVIAHVADAMKGEDTGATMVDKAKDATTDGEKGSQWGKLSGRREELRKKLEVVKAQRLKKLARRLSASISMGKKGGFGNLAMTHTLDCQSAVESAKSVSAADPAPTLAVPSTATGAEAGDEKDDIEVGEEEGGEGGKEEQEEEQEEQQEEEEEKGAAAAKNKAKPVETDEASSVESDEKAKHAAASRIGAWAQGCWARKKGLEYSVHFEEGPLGLVITNLTITDVIPGSQADRGMVSVQSTVQSLGGMRVESDMMLSAAMQMKGRPVVMVLHMPSKAVRAKNRAAKRIQKLLRWRWAKQRGVPYAVKIVEGDVDFELKDLKVTKVAAGGQAETAGMSAGSIITAVGGRSCSTDGECALLMRVTPRPFMMQLLQLQLPPTPLHKLSVGGKQTVIDVAKAGPKKWKEKMVEVGAYAIIARSKRKKDYAEEMPLKRCALVSMGAVDSSFATKHTDKEWAIAIACTPDGKGANEEKSYWVLACESEKQWAHWTELLCRRCKLTAEEDVAKFRKKDEELKKEETKQELEARIRKEMEGTAKQEANERAAKEAEEEKAKEEEQAKEEEKAKEANKAKEEEKAKEAKAEKDAAAKKEEEEVEAARVNGEH
jgi:hypothetical protein